MRSRMGADRTAGHRRVGPTRDGCHGNDDDPAGAHRRQWIVCRGRRAMKITITLLANAVALLLLATPLAEAQQTRRIPRVRVLGGQSPEGSPPILALRQGLSELGYVEDQARTMLFAYRACITQLAAKHRLPTMAWQRAMGRPAA